MRDASVSQDGRLALRSGMRYRYLVLNRSGPWRFTGKMDREEVLDMRLPMAISPATLLKITGLVEAGMTLVGRRPTRAIGLTDHPHRDSEVRRLADALWGATDAEAGERRVGRGRVIWGRDLEEVLAADGLKPDLEITEDPSTAALPPDTLSNIPNPAGSFDWIHRETNGVEIYFIANLRRVAAAGRFTFRINGRRPELWDPVSGAIRDLPQYASTRDGRTEVPLSFAGRQSFFVVFRARAQPPTAAGGRGNFPAPQPVLELTGTWEVKFDPQWYYPDDGTGGRVRFERLTDWTQRAEEAIRHYSGTATYRTHFDWSPRAEGTTVWLDLGIVRNLARVRLNGRDLGVVWTAPWRVEITSALRPGPNDLAIEVVNLWANRVIGDDGLPAAQRRTRHNIPPGKLKPTELFSSGLLGPVVIQATPAVSRSDH